MVRTRLVMAFLLKTKVRLLMEDPSSGSSPGTYSTAETPLPCNEDLLLLLLHDPGIIEG